MCRYFSDGPLGALGDTFEVRAAILEWISKTMGEWPNSGMTIFPHNWFGCDEDRCRWIFQIETHFDDPGDGQVYEASNIIILTHAGHGRFSCEGGRTTPPPSPPW